MMGSTLTRRQNFLRTLRHEPHARLPAYLVIDNFNYTNPLPAGVDLERICTFTDPAGLVELSRYFGLDSLMRITPSPVRVDLTPERARTWTETLPGGLTATFWETPRGKLRTLHRQSAEAHTNFGIEHPIKQLQDYEILLSILASQVFTLETQTNAEVAGYLDVIGDEGIAYVVGPPTPIMDLTRTWAGLEQFIYHLRDAPELVETVLAAMAEGYCRQYELIAAHSPCQVMVLWDDANSLYISPRMFEKYSVPVLRRYAEIAHRHGKLLVNHTCGKIAAFLDLYTQTGADSIDWVTPAPTGDVLPAQAQAQWAGKITMQLAVVPAVMRHGSPEQVEEHIHALLHGLDLCGDLVLMIPPPVGTPLANVRRAVEVLVRDYGVPLNRSRVLGSVLDEAGGQAL
jgi:hypothetical protein